jgi:hypothetical protein
VLNVNVTARPGDGWERAVHDEWLQLARDQVAQLLEVAFKALVFMNEMMNGEMFPDLPEKCGRWGSLLGLKRE